MSSTTWEMNKKKEKSRQVTAFAAGLGSSCLERVVIPYTNSPSTNPNAKVVRFCESANALLKKSACFAAKGEQFVAVILVLLLPGLDFCGEAFGKAFD